MAFWRRYVDLVAAFVGYFDWKRWISTFARDLRRSAASKVASVK